MNSKVKKLFCIVKFSSRVQYFFYGFLVIVYGCVFYWNFERSVIPPQTGWWQYMAWRMSEGELPYKDFYVFIPPYFLMLTSFFFNFFGKNFIWYAAIGFLLTRILMWLMLYKMLSSVFKPLYAAIGLITGISITAAYLMDQTYDYNPLITCGVVIISYFLFKMNEYEIKKKYIYTFLIGILCGCMIMMKQTVAIICPVVSFVCFLIIIWRAEHKVRPCIVGALLFCSGMVIAILPGIIYLCKNHIWKDFSWCISSALEAKIVNTGLLQLCFKNFFRLNELICAFGIEVNYIICSKYKFHKNPIIVASSMILSALLLFNEFYENFNNFRIGAGYKFTKYIAIFLICWIVLCLIDYLFRKIENGTSFIISFVMVCFIVIIGFASKYIDWKWSTLLYDGINFASIKTKILYIGIYICIFIWLKSAYSFFILKNEKSKKVFAPFTLLILYVGCLFASFSLEELYAVIFISISIAYLFEFGLSSRITKYGSMILCFILCFLCLNQKIYLPYTWHGWQSSSLVKNETLNYSNIEGLKGYVLSDNDEKSYSDIVSLILANSTDEDTLFQFTNMPLFNVLTERKSVYVPILYFDVCPDSVAEDVAECLEEDNPMLVLFHEMDEWRWVLHEDAFRNSKPCGQRSILNFYNNQVKTTYRFLGAFNNNMGENVCLWKKTIFNGGYADQSMLVNANNPIKQKIEFTDTIFSKLAIQGIAGDDLFGVELQITLKNLSDGNIIIDDSYILNEVEGNYYVCELGEHIVNKNDLYELSITCNDDRSHNFGFCSETDGKYGVTIDDEKIDMVFSMTID